MMLTYLRPWTKDRDLPRAYSEGAALVVLYHQACVKPGHLFSTISQFSIATSEDISHTAPSLRDNYVFYRDYRTSFALMRRFLTNQWNALNLGTTHWCLDAIGMMDVEEAELQYLFYAILPNRCLSGSKVPHTRGHGIPSIQILDLFYYVSGIGRQFQARSNRSELVTTNMDAWRMNMLAAS